MARRCSSRWSRPSSPASVLLGRVMSLMCFGLLSLIEVWVVGKLVFGVSIPFEHPGELVATLAVTAVAMGGLAVAFSALLVMTRNAYTFTNSASFPSLLGGVFVPVASLPDWVQPISTVLFVSWSSRTCSGNRQGRAGRGLLAAAGDGLLLGAIVPGRRVILHYVLRRMRSNGGWQSHDRVGEHRKRDAARLPGRPGGLSGDLHVEELARRLVRTRSRAGRLLRLIGERLGDDEATYYLLVGNSLLIAAQVGVFSLNMTSSERWTGTPRCSSQAPRARSSSSRPAGRISRSTAP